MAAKKAKSAAKSKRGGRRVGAGRKPKAVNRLRAEIVAEAEKTICENLPCLIENMVVLANGGYQRVEEKWEPSIEKAGELVLVERKVSVADRDRAANQYLIDRVLGKPTERHEHDFSKLKDGDLLAEIAGALARGEAAGAEVATG